MFLMYILTVILVIIACLFKLLSIVTTLFITSFLILFNVNCPVDLAQS